LNRTPYQNTSTKYINKPIDNRLDMLYTSCIIYHDAGHMQQRSTLFLFVTHAEENGNPPHKNISPVA